MTFFTEIEHYVKMSGIDWPKATHEVYPPKDEVLAILSNFKEVLKGRPSSTCVLMLDWKRLMLFGKSWPIWQKLKGDRDLRVALLKFLGEE